MKQIGKKQMRANILISHFESILNIFLYQDMDIEEIQKWRNLNRDFENNFWQGLNINKKDIVYLIEMEKRIEELQNYETQSHPRKKGKIITPFDELDFFVAQKSKK